MNFAGNGTGEKKIKHKSKLFLNLAYLIFPKLPQKQGESVFQKEQGFALLLL